MIGIVVGIIGIYGIKPVMADVIKYPTPENCDRLIYKDKNGMCYKYNTKVVNCDANENRLKSFPIS